MVVDMNDGVKKRSAHKLKIKNLYPLNNARRMYFEVRRAAFRFIKAKADLDLFLSITELNDGWDYTVKRIRKITSLTLPQISKSKANLIKLGILSIDHESSTITINYEVVMGESFGVANDTPNIIIQDFDDYNDEFGDEFPESLGGGSIYSK